MKKLSIVTGLFLIAVGGAGCSGNQTAELHQPTSPQYVAKYDYSFPAAVVDLEQALNTSAASLKLSQIASEISYYNVGDVRYTVTQAIALQDSNAFLTFNNPRLYYRKQGIPSKRYGFKALAYKWNNEMGGRPLFYDKKTTRMYVALSGKDQETRRNATQGEPCIGVLPSLDTMLTVFNYYFPEGLTEKYRIHAPEKALVGFSSNGYILAQYAGNSGVPEGITSFNLQGDTLCRFQLNAGKYPTWEELAETPGAFKTSYWNISQDKLTFMIPFCDTVYQLKDSQTVKPLYALHFGKYGIVPAETPKGDELDKKVWLKTLYENPKGVFMGLYQKNGRKILNWLGWEDEYKPLLTTQAVYLKDTGKTYILPSREKGFVNDLDGGLTFWPDGQTDDCLYMIRSVTEMREMVIRTGEAKQQQLIDFLDDPAVYERDYVMIVVR